MERLVLELSKRYSHNRLVEWGVSSNYRINFKAVFFAEQAKIIDDNLKMIY